MIEREAISVSPTPELHAFVRDPAGTGNHGSVSEVVRAGLRLLRGREAGVQGHPPDRADAPQSEEG